MRLVFALLFAGIVAVASCGKHQAPEPATPPPAPSPSPTPAQVREESSPTPAQLDPVSQDGTVGVDEPASPEVQSPDQVTLDTKDRETRLVRQEVLKRIDLVPNMSPDQRDQLYVSLDRARGMGKVVVIPFASGSTSVGSKEIAALSENLKQAQIKALVEDPTVIFVVAGFADKKGDPQKNIIISRQRAESVMRALRDYCGVVNLIQPIGMGGSELFDGQSFDKNRVVEVWAVLP